MLTQLKSNSCNTISSYLTLKQFFALPLLLLLLLAGCATSQTSPHSRTPYEIALSDTSFSVLDGRVDLKNISISIEDAVVNDEIVASPNNIRATATNKTDASLETITFDVSLKTKTGRTVASEPVSVTNTTRPNSVSKLDYPLAESMYGQIKYKDGMSFELDFRDASYVSQYSFTLVDRDGLSFENDSLRIDFTPTKEGIGFEMKNKTNKSIQILWDRVSFVDTKGSSHSVIKGGTQYSKRNESIKPTSIAPNSFVEDVIFPSDYIRYDSYFEEYDKKNLFPNGQESERFNGKNFFVYMPLLFGGEEKSLNFEFKITDVSY